VRITFSVWLVSGYAHVLYYFPLSLSRSLTEPFVCWGVDSYMEDSGPLLDDCLCYTCQTHTRAYLHHLVSTSELLANVLLMMYALMFLRICFYTRVSVNQWSHCATSNSRHCAL